MEVRNNVRSSERLWAITATIFTDSIVHAKHSTFRITLDRSLVLTKFTSRRNTRRILAGVTITLVIVTIINALTSVKADMLVVRTHLDNMLA
jgi:hypothetical protein